MIQNNLLNYNSDNNIEKIKVLRPFMVVKPIILYTRSIYFNL